MNRVWAVGILLVALLLAMETVMANEIAKQAKYVDEKEYKMGSTYLELDENYLRKRCS